jgi:hypothetical protein
VLTDQRYHRVADVLRIPEVNLYRYFDYRQATNHATRQA